MKTASVMLSVIAAGALAQPQIVNSFDAPDTGVTGLAYADNDLYAVTSSRVIYRMDPVTGQVEDSFSITPTGPDGLGYAGSLLYVTNGTSNVYKYTLGGTSEGTTSLYCSG